MRRSRTRNHCHYGAISAIMKYLLLIGTLLQIVLISSCFKLRGDGNGDRDGNENTVLEGNSDETSATDSNSESDLQAVDVPGEPFNPSEFKEAKSMGATRNPHGSRAYENEVQFQRNFFLKNGLNAESKRWLKVNDAVVVPYLISSKFSSTERLTIVKAFDDFHENTCIKFVPRSNQRDYVNILSQGGCDSDAGRMGGEQILNLGRDCVYTDIAIHELNHAVGFWHEQNRPDRDNYITVYLQNVIPENRYNFDKMTPAQVNAYGQKYDTGSIMHYDKYAFSKDYGKLVVMEPKNGDENMGLATVLSQTDIAKINQMYRCGNKKKGPQKNPKNPKKSGQNLFAEYKINDECVDTHSSCETFVSRAANDEEDNCVSNPWVKVNCRKSCGLCGSMCQDSHEQCPLWALNGECQQYEDYMHIYCPKSCLMC